MDVNSGETTSQIQFAAQSLCLTEARGDFASILLGLVGEPLMEASYNSTDTGRKINK